MTRAWRKSTSPIAGALHHGAAARWGLPGGCRQRRGLPRAAHGAARPDLRVTFLDSLQKRLTFLAQLTQRVGAALHARAEDAGQDKAYRDRFDVAMARAVANLNALAGRLPAPGQGRRPFLALKGAAGETVACCGPRRHHQAGRLGGGHPSLRPARRGCPGAHRHP